VRAMAWKYGFRVWIGRYSLALLGPRDPRMFSERNGYRSPIIRVGPWRVFVDKPNTPRSGAERPAGADGSVFDSTKGSVK